jgi:hypothetical protein
MFSLSIHIYPEMKPLLFCFCEFLTFWLLPSNY